MENTNQELQIKDLQLHKDLMAAAAAAQKSVNILIDADDLGFLKDNKYMLCFAKKVGDSFNVVWQAYDKFLANNNFSWVPQFQLFGSNVFMEQVKVQVSTNPITIGLGQKSTLSKVGLLSQASDGGPLISITMDNEFGPIHAGLNNLSIGLDGNQVSTPIYVAPLGAALGDVVLTPKDAVLVWFQQYIETSTMFSSARSNSIEIDLTQTNTATRLYKGGEWITP